ncbi:DUF1707 SHOCT-like domain-containing protein [Nonomuraea sp. SBT364]|uniref:DUF1707 SHOCT-like domain-containing protein n=1 Tax=Nonomuraea sp. SBT364 TaxID=1580530 RepID=UPI00069F3718|nr:DUF1707 domain-containing protein [Nonomuraea sp. SBT364]
MEGVATAMEHGDLRIGDAERERTMASLREHFALGRLTHEELDERLDQTLAARTQRDLAKVTEDLPGEGRGHAGPVPPHTIDSWQAAMREQRDHMRELARRHPGMSRDMRKPWHGGHPGRRHGHGPGPFIPLLAMAMVALVVVGGAGIFKALFFFILVAMVFSLVKRARQRK